MLTVSSAPGKVLITGGYLVLERPCAGIVLSLSSRFEARVKSLHHPNSSHQSFSVVVQSPQFDTEVTYRITLLEDGTGQCEAEVGQGNAYVSKALLWSVLFAAHATKRSHAFEDKIKGGLHIVVQGDNDFYSQLDELERRKLPSSSASLRSLPKFMRVGNGLSSMRKTGLGSSAALVTCIVAGVCCHLGAAHVERDLETLHNLAQFCHCLAQGKIGSGFDVSSAAFGTQVYTRFSPSILDPLLKKAERAELGTEECMSTIAKQWDNLHEKVRLPKGMRLVLGDVSVGSNTPVMVSQVLKWKHENPEMSSALWKKIDGFNQDIRAGLEALEHEDLHECANMSSSDWVAKGGECGKKLDTLRKSFIHARQGLKELGDLAGVPIEPAEQTALCNATQAIQGVLAAGVPGAGGFDAIFALLLNDDAAERVEHFWTTWKETKVVPMIVREDPRGIQVEQHAQ